MKRVLFFMSGMLLISLGYAQNEAVSTVEEDQIHEEVSTLRDYFINGQVSGHVRNYLMSTINNKELTDYYANAIGASLHLETANWHGLKFGLKGIFTYQLFASDLEKVDPLAGKSSKWERELFDVNDPHNTKHMDRLEEFYAMYSFRKSFVQFGKFDIQSTPLLSRRDGRMKPFAFEGLWSELNELKHVKVNLGWIFAVSPRAMTEWYKANEAIGMNNNGFQPDGQKANYHENTQSSGVGVVGINYKPSAKWSVQFWEYYFDNIMNVNWLQVDYRSEGLLFGAQYALELPDKYLDGLVYEQRYMQPDEKGQVLAFRGGYKVNQMEYSLNYAHSFKTGRFLFPREFGRENFYTSIPRSWMDGFGDTDILTFIAKFTGMKKAQGFSAELRASSVWTPAVSTYTHNKYNIQPYNQTNLFLKYNFSGKLEGLETGFLYVSRFNHPHTENSPGQIFNKTNYHQLNFITNINF
ncbi:MAG: OprD family outer membrane porin [Cyclobacteriaceae bacterium]|nr:OprD family outer membrane porin [Cyclobacteriaceae bacterium]